MSEKKIIKTLKELLKASEQVQVAQIREILNETDKPRKRGRPIMYPERHQKAEGGDTVTKQRGRKANHRYINEKGEWDASRYYQDPIIKARLRLAARVPVLCECGMTLRRDKLRAHRQNRIHARIMAGKVVAAETIERDETDKPAA